GWRVSFHVISTGLCRIMCRRLQTAFNDTIWPERDDGTIPLPDGLFSGQAEKKQKHAEEVVDWAQIPRQDWLEFTSEPETIAHTDLLSSDWVQKTEECREHDLDPEGEAAFYHPSFRFKQPAFAVHIQLLEKRKGKPQQKIWDVIYAGGAGADNEIVRSATPNGGSHPLFRQFCQPLSEETRYELHVTDVTRNRKGKPKRSFDEILELRPKPDLPRSFHLKKGMKVPKKFSFDYWLRKEKKEQDREKKLNFLMQGLAWSPRRPLTVAKKNFPDGPIDFSPWRIDPETGERVSREDLADFL
ncbi:unnamed protein product, partial [Symbiodinium microadriaticum]